MSSGFSNKTPGLLRSWRQVRLGDVCSKPQYGWTTKAATERGSIKLLRTTDITPGRIDWSCVPYCTEPPPDLAKYLVHEGDILISRAGSVGVSHLVTAAELSVFASYLIRFKPGPEILPKYLAHFLRSANYWRQIADNTAGIAVPNVNASKLQEVMLPLAPLDAQAEIIAEIEKQFSRLDEAVANLKRVKVKLKRYKAAVLKAAVEGRLVPTEAELARREGRRYETGAQLLQHVLKSRRTALRGKWIEPDPPDITDLPKLPIGWEWASIDQIAADTQIGLDRRRESQNEEHRGSPYVKMNNVNLDGDVSWDGLVYVEASANEQQRFGVRDGDLLFNTRNSTELVGKIGLVLSPPERAIYNNNLMRIRVASGVLSAFVCAQMCSMGFRARMEKIKRATTNVAAVYAKDLLPLAIAVPPTAEQLRVVAELDRRLSIVREVEHEVDANLRRAERLRQATLQDAFLGTSSAR